MKLTEEHLGVLERQEIGIPSWAFRNTGTRLRVFGQTGVPRSVFEKIDDAAMVHELTGNAPRVALQGPWDRTNDYTALTFYAKNQKVP